MQKKKFEFTYEAIITYLSKNKLVVTLRVASIALISMGGIYSTLLLFANFNSIDISGQWFFTTEIQQSTYSPYIGMSIGYKLFISQNANELTGTGEKFLENGNEIPFSEHIRINFSGKVDGKKLLIHYIEFGKRRTTIGEFVLELKEKKLMEGTFSTTAANSSGLVTATKQ